MSQQHVAKVTRSDVTPRGWSEAWIWVCSCGRSSWSILRSVGEAQRDHRQEHVERLERCVVCGSTEQSDQGGLCPEHTYDVEDVR